MPPEIVNKQKYDEKVDVWSAGVVCFILLSGKPPFIGNTKDEVYNSIKQVVHSYRSPEWSKVSSKAIDFIKKCLDKNPKTRLSAEDLLHHPWLDQADPNKKENPEAQAKLNQTLAQAGDNL